MLDGGVDNDWLDGGVGSDIYLFDCGSGEDRINEVDCSIVVRVFLDVVILGVGICQDDLYVFCNCWDDLIFNVVGSFD